MRVALSNFKALAFSSSTYAVLFPLYELFVGETLVTSSSPPNISSHKLNFYFNFNSLCIIFVPTISQGSILSAPAELRMQGRTEYFPGYFNTRGGDLFF